MKKSRLPLFFVTALWVFMSPAGAQIKPSGSSFTPGHTARVMNPQGTLLGDAGGAKGSAVPGQNYLTELGITNTGTPLCINDALTNATGGYHALCLGANSLGGGLISYNALGGASALPLNFNINGMLIPFPPPTGGGSSGACSSITGFGGAGDGISDNTAALTAAIAAAASNHGACIAFPPGRFKFAAPYSFTYPAPAGAPYASITMVGAGADTTELIGPAGGSLFTFTMTAVGQSFHMRDMSLETPSACAGCAALSLVQTQSVGAAAASAGPQNDLTRVSIYGTDRAPLGAFGVGNNYWGTGVSVNGVSNINFIGVFIQGKQPAAEPSVGVRLYSSNANIVPVVFNFVAFQANLLQTGLSYDAYTQGVTISQSNFTGDETGIQTPASAAGTTLDQLSITDTQFNCNTAIDLPQFVADVTIVGNTFIIGQGAAGHAPAGYTAINAQGAANMSISNNSFQGYGSIPRYGINLFEPTYAGSIADNVFRNMTEGFSIQSGAAGYTINNNSMVNVITPLINNAALTANRIDIEQDCSSLVNLQFGGASTGITYSQKFCQFVWVGYQLTADVSYVLSSKGTATGTATLSLPVGSSNFNPHGSVPFGFISGFTLAAGSNTVQGLINPAASTMNFFTTLSGNSSGLSDTSFTNTAIFRAHIQYRTN